MTNEMSEEEKRKKDEYDREIEDLLFKGMLVRRYFGEDKDGNIRPSVFYPDQVSRDLQRHRKIVTLRDNDAIYIYNQKLGYYESDGRQRLRELINKMLGAHYREHRATEVIHKITASTYIEREHFALPDYLIPVRNGLLDISENPPKLTPHSPDYFITGVLPVGYNPDAKCSEFLRFLEQILPEMTERIKIQEGFGNCLTSSHEYMIIYFLYGEGYNGKSTLLNVLKALLGDKNCSTASIGQLVYRRWYVATLYRKLANICGDVGLKELKHTGVIKILTGEDTAFGERKYQRPFSFTSHAKPWFSGNMIPYIYDNTDAFHRRWRIMIFKQKFPKGSPQTNPQMIRKLTTSEELSGILNWALEGYYRMRKQKTFSLLRSVEDRRMQWQELSDPLSVFLANCVVYGDSVSKEAFYLSSRQYCVEHGLPVISKSLVGRKMKELGYGEIYAGEEGKQKRSWLGIEVKSEFLVVSEEEKRFQELHGEI